MWWLVIPAAALVGKLIYEAVRDDEPAVISEKGILEKNLTRLAIELRSVPLTKIAFIGQPGAGKSTTLKKLSKGKVDPPPVIGQQTDATDWSADEDVRLTSRWNDLLFVDAPGYDTASHPAQPYLDLFPFELFDKTFLFVKGKLVTADQMVFDRIRSAGTMPTVIRSYADVIDQQEDVKIRRDLVAKLPGLSARSIIFLSNRTGRGLKCLSRALARDA